MAGEHQVQNAVTALCALDVMRSEGIIRSDGEALRKGMKAARLDGRFHVAKENPYIIYDGAHNPDGANALVKTLKELLPDGKILFVTSILRDKAASEMLGIFSGVADSFVATASANERALSAGELASMIREAGGTVAAQAESPGEAYEAAMALSGEFDAVVFAGSLYMIGEVMR